MRECEICGGKVFAKGLCSAHYQRQRRYNDPEAERSRGPEKTPVRLYMERNGDWENLAERSRKKYLKAASILYNHLGWYYDFATDDAPFEVASWRRVEMALKLARLIGYDEDLERWNFTKLEREVDEIAATEQEAEEMNRYERLAPALKNMRT